jgi:hypothetical protein
VVDGCYFSHSQSISYQLSQIRRLKERCGLEARTNFFSFKKVTKTRCGLDSRIYGIYEAKNSRYEIYIFRFSPEKVCRLVNL